MSKKLKIAIIGSRGYPYVYSGYETLVKELSERLVKSGSEVTVYCHKKLFNEKPSKVNGVNLIYTPSINSKIFSQLYNSFFSFIHVCFSNVDVVFVVNSANGPFGILTKIFRKKTCINVDGLEWLRPKWKGLGSLYYRYSSKLSTLLFDRIITDCEEMKLIYKKKYNKNSSVIAYGPTMIKSVSKQILNKFSLKENDYYLIVGRLIPDNNSKLIIDSFLKSRSNKKIVIVGDVPYYDSYSQSVKNLVSDRIILTGYINDQLTLSCLYENCFGYIHGHEFGGTNPTMINALFFNCSILALNTVFNKEMTENKNVIFFNKSFKSIVNSINFFEANHSELINSNVYYQISSIYNWDTIAKKYEAEFYKLIL